MKQQLHWEPTRSCALWPWLEQHWAALGGAQPHAKCCGGRHGLHRLGELSWKIDEQHVKGQKKKILHFEIRAKNTMILAPSHFKW